MVSSVDCAVCVVCGLPKEPTPNKIMSLSRATLMPSLQMRDDAVLLVHGFTREAHENQQGPMGTKDVVAICLEFYSSNARAEWKTGSSCQVYDGSEWSNGIVASASKEDEWIAIDTRVARYFGTGPDITVSKRVHRYGPDIRPHVES